MHLMLMVETMLLKRILAVVRSVVLVLMLWQIYTILTTVHCMQWGYLFLGQ